MKPQDPPVRLNIHADRDTFRIGESIRLRLCIRNATTAEVNFLRIAWNGEVLAFTPPTVARLIAPDGTDLLAPYARLASFPFGDPWRVPPGAEEHFQLPITPHLALRQPGEHRFTLALDEDGRVHQSNPLSFQLADVEVSLPAGALELTLAFPKPSMGRGERIAPVAVFVNHSGGPVVVLRPQQDSFDGWTNPSFLFHVTDAEGRGLPRALRCGNLATPAYDVAAFLTVPPGGSATVALPLTDVPGLERPGRYRVRLTYIVRRGAVGVGGVPIAGAPAWPGGTFLGRLESNETTLWIQ